MSQSGIAKTAVIPPGTYLQTLTGDSGGAVGADGAGNIDVLGGANITVDGNPGANELEINLTGTTDHAVQVGNASGSLTSLALGNAGFVLTSNGAGVDPSFQTLPASGITSITGDSGGAQTGPAITLTGGATGLTFGGAANTITLAGTLAIANGGTNATSMSTSNGIVKYNGTRLVTSTTAQIDASNRMTNTSQPAFLAYNSTIRSNETGDGTPYTLIFDTERFDQNNNFDGTSTFTAPVTGRYNLTCFVLLQDMVAANGATLQIITSNITYTFGNYASTVIGNFPIEMTVFADMDSGDTAVCVVTADSAAKVVDIYGGVGDPRTVFCGNLVC